MLAVIAAMAVWAPWRRSAIDDRPLVRLDVDLGADVSLGSPQGTDVIISPDGDRLVWVSQNRLCTAATQSNPRPLSSRARRVRLRLSFAGRPVGGLLRRR